MMKELYALLLASTLMVPHIAPALGADGTRQPSVSHQGQTLGQSPGQLQLPPVPDLESMPWLKSLSTSKGTKIDFLDPKFQVPGPFLAEFMMLQARGSPIASSFASPAIGADTGGFARDDALNPMWLSSRAETCRSSLMVPLFGYALPD
jgi:hypothetical protein